MSAKPLSKTQQELLDALKAGVVVHYMRYMGSFNPNPYFWREDGGGRCTPAAKGLIDKGLAIHDRKKDFLILAPLDKAEGK